LAFFDGTNRDHITIKETSGGETTYLTYLPQFDDIELCPNLGDGAI